MHLYLEHFAINISKSAMIHKYSYFFEKKNYFKLNNFNYL